MNNELNGRLVEYSAIDPENSEAVGGIAIILNDPRPGEAVTRYSVHRVTVSGNTAEWVSLAVWHERTINSARRRMMYRLAVENTLVPR